MFIKLSLLLSWYSDGKDQPVAFTYCAGTSTLSLENLSLNIGTDWEVHIKWQRGASGDEYREQPAPFSLSLGLFWDLCYPLIGSKKSFISHQFTTKQ